MGGIGSMSASGFEESALLEAGEYGFEQLILHLPFNQPGAKLTENGKIKALIC
jgi:hypothetical protein